MQCGGFDPAIREACRDLNAGVEHCLKTYFYASIDPGALFRLFFFFLGLFFFYGMPDMIPLPVQRHPYSPSHTCTLYRLITVPAFSKE